MRLFRPVVLAGVSFAVISILLPFASFPVVGSVDGLSADAWPALLPLIPLSLIAIIGRWDLGFDPIAGLTAVVLSALSLAFSLVKIADAVVSVRETSGATLGPGAWVLAISVGMATAGAAYGALTRS